MERNELTDEQKLDILIWLRCASIFGRRCLRRAGSDKVAQHYITKGTKEDLMRWLNTSANEEELRS